MLDSKSNLCYFKKLTLDKFIKKSATKVFNTTADALRLLGCERKDYHEGEKNVWCVEMPDFVNHQAVKAKPKDSISEMDEQYHAGKFRAPEAQKDTPKNN